LVIASGTNRVNEKRIQQIVREAVEIADAEYVRDVTGFVIGGVPLSVIPQVFAPSLTPIFLNSM